MTHSVLSFALIPVASLLFRCGPVCSTTPSDDESSTESTCTDSTAGSASFPSSGTRSSQLDECDEHAIEGRGCLQVSIQTNHITLDGVFYENAAIDLNTKFAAAIKQKYNIPLYEGSELFTETVNTEDFLEDLNFEIQGAMSLKIESPRDGLWTAYALLPGSYMLDVWRKRTIEVVHTNPYRVVMYCAFIRRSIPFTISPGHKTQLAPIQDYDLTLMKTACYKFG